ncbi:ADP-ribosylglycohydrolase family protein [Ruania zhangjianzhongii]|uniref:ADP-ribosylglycohydrolase family protein n=1 Tax=Ruania zhangjianzhongii TaxID=2603206 RepID=UPI0011CC330E|nr:ADP-ribosylglycohydrolase family protein [Ruania zhangjianzhongii]
MTAQLLSAIHGSLAAACIADALGAPTEELSRAQIRTAFNGHVTEFHDPLPGAPYARGRSAAQITDDSSQMIMLTELLVRTGGALTPQDMAGLLVEWSKNENYYPHFAGPTTRAAIEQLAEGADPWQVGRSGTIMTQGASNGGAMRVAPVGLFHHGNPQAAVQTAFTTCVPSHNTTAGVAGAAAVAAAVADACREEATLTSVVRAAKAGAREGAELGRTQGRDVPGARIDRRIDRAVALAMTAESDEEAIDLIEGEIGVGLPAAEAVPAAIGFFVAAAGDPIRTAELAANAGGDSDTIGCMAASIAGAFSGIDAIDPATVTTVEQANGLDLHPLAQSLLQASAK